MRTHVAISGISGSLLHLLAIGDSSLCTLTGHACNLTRQHHQPPVLSPPYNHPLAYTASADARKLEFEMLMKSKEVDFLLRQDSLFSALKQGRLIFNHFAKFTSGPSPGRLHHTRSEKNTCFVFEVRTQLSNCIVNGRGSLSSWRRAINPSFFGSTPSGLTMKKSRMEPQLTNGCQLVMKIGRT